MSRETTHKGLEVVIRKWWFFLIFLLIQFIPPYASKGLVWEKAGDFTVEVLSHALMYSLRPLYPIFKIAPILLVISMVFFKNRIVRLFAGYVATTYVLFALLQSIAVTESYGLGIITSNMVLFLIVAVFWMWEAIVKRNDFTSRKPPLWKYWVVPLAFLAFWYPADSVTLVPDFQPVSLVTNGAGLAFCMMTPVYIAILSFYHPRINMAVLRVTALAGIIIGFYNMWVNFFMNPAVLWWNGVLHIPLVTLSSYGLVLSFKRVLEKTPDNPG